METTQRLLFLVTFLIHCITNVENINLRLDPLVDSNAGLIRGLHASDGDYSMFLGIPFANVNQSNPFGIATPQEKFRNIFEAYDDSLMLCPQYQSSGIKIGDINCLFLNVYVPNSANSQNRLPVMIYIHGGSFTSGSGRISEYGPKYLVNKGIILVSINYRLGPYGFMCLHTPDVPGNQGLKDQVLAFRWVKDNIEAFGGDVNRITLFGRSSGGISIDLHLLAEHDNLFNRVIMQSGTSLASKVLQTPGKPDTVAPVKIANFLGFETDSVSEALNFIAQIDSHLVITTANTLNMVFKPCIETEFNDIKPFLTKPWINAEIPKVKGMPILIGFNNKERSSQYVTKKPEYFENLNIIHEKLDQSFNFDDNELAEMENIVHHFYLGDEKINITLKDEIGDFDSDCTYIHPIQRSIKQYIENSAENIFYYMFSYSGGRNFYRARNNITGEGAFHTDEIGYLFDVSFLPEDNEKDMLVLEQMTTMWTNFAKYEDPTPATSELLPVKWTPLTEDKWNYLNIDSELSIKSRPLKERMAFWDLFYKLNEDAQRQFEG